MSQSAYIKLVQGSAVDTISLEDVKNRLLEYRRQTSLTGAQLDWNYAEAAFPYTIESKDDGWFYLQGMNPLYKFIIFGVGETERGESQVPCIQVVLPDGSTHGDKAKANEFCKYLGKHLQGELTMFNGRTVYYYPRK
ncbi:DUF1885 family protein [Paenibacillus sp. GCM10023252]|uniref:DUF1885 family protein n=1 Tax=Paenibacillus sp. GCM10023252 TaxID=3252649 RepID=UPI00361E7A21